MVTLIRDCRDHGPHEGTMCPKCAEEIANGGAVRSIQGMMAASLEALARRLK